MEQHVVMANKLKSLMEEKGVSYRDLAKTSGLSVRRVYRIVNGMVSNPGVFVMRDICKSLEISLDELLETM